MASEREMGEFSARLGAVERDVKEIKADLKTVLAKQSEAQGHATGFRAGMVLVIAAMGGGATLAAQKLFALMGGPK